jgi:hypothetical protein
VEEVALETCGVAELGEEFIKVTACFKNDESYPNSATPNL